MAGVLGILMLFYPIWGLVPLLIFCRMFEVDGTLGERGARALLVAGFATVIFTPALFGTEGFGFFAPWPIYFFYPKNTGFYWPLGAAVFVLAFIFSVRSVSGKAK